MDERLVSPEDALDVEGHSLTRNDNETVVVDVSTPNEEESFDVEGHALTRNDNETVVVDAEAETADRPVD